MNIYEPPINVMVAGLLLIAAADSARRATRRLVRGLGEAAPLDVVRGLRACAIALALGAAALGILRAQTGFVVLGAIFLGEELYETGVLAAILRTADRHSTG